MLSLRQNAYTLILAALICGVLLSIVHNCRQEALIRLVCGMFLMTLLISSWTNMTWRQDISVFQDAQQNSQTYVKEGAEIARQKQVQIISEQLEAYIIEKAMEMNAEIIPVVTIGEDLLPDYVQIKGKIEPDIKETLSEVMEHDLNISKERQLWTG